MIAVICAMQEERDALLKLMKDVKISKGKKLLYHGKYLDNEYYVGTLGKKQIVVCRCGVGEIYATMAAVLLIQKFKPELVVNLGCAGSLNEDVHVGDIVVASCAANWRVDVPGWKRSADSMTCSYPCDEKASSIAKKIKCDLRIHLGPIVSADEFIYKKAQVKEIRKYFPESLCGEMEGAAIAGTCYAFNTPVSIIRSISDETLIQGNYREFEFNLQSVCEKAALLCKEIIKRY